MATLHAIAAAFLISVAAGAVHVAGDGGDTMTICHKPGTSAQKTLEVPREAWNGHRGHGDHTGACDHEPHHSSGGAGGSGGAREEAEQEITTLRLDDRASGGLDGTASFKLTIFNDGPYPGKDLRLAAQLHGDGRWSLADDAGMDCSLERRLMTCEADHLAGGGRLVVTLAFDAGPSICRAASLDASLEASNDASRGDDDAGGSVRTGACAAPDVPP